MSRFDWSDVYPGTRMVTLVLDEALADEFLAQAADEGMLIAKDVVRGLPAIIAEPAQPAIADKSPSATETPDEPDAPEPVAEPPNNIFILPTVWHERMEETPPARPGPCRPKTPIKRPPKADIKPVETGLNRRSILDEKPPERDIPTAEPAVRYFAGKGPVRRGEVTPEDRAMVEAALRDGTVTVTKCPPGHARADYHQTGSDWGTISGNERQKAKLKELKKRREANHGQG